jgi:hypothetical protein
LSIEFKQPCRHIRIAQNQLHGQTYRPTIDDEVTLTLKGSIVNEEVGSNQDGSVNICYVLKAMEVQVQEQKKGDHESPDAPYNDG